MNTSNDMSDLKYNSKYDGWTFKQQQYQQQEKQQQQQNKNKLCIFNITLIEYFQNLD